MRAVTARGSVLVLTLWALAILALAAAALSRRARAELTLIRRLEDEATLLSAAREGAAHVRETARRVGVAYTALNMPPFTAATGPVNEVLDETGAERPFTALPPNVNTAPPATLAKLGMPPALVEKWLAFRAGPDGRPGTDDDGVVRSARTLEGAGGSMPPLSIDEAALVARLAAARRIGVRSDAFRVMMTVTAPGGARRRVTAVVSASESDTIRFWHEHD